MYRRLSEKSSSSAFKTFLLCFVFWFSLACFAPIASSEDLSTVIAYRDRVARNMEVFNSLCKILTFPDEIKTGNFPPDNVLNLVPRIRDNFIAAQQRLEELKPPRGYGVSHRLLLRSFDYYIGALNFMIQGINRASQGRDPSRSFNEMENFLLKGNEALGQVKRLASELSEKNEAGNEKKQKRKVDLRISNLSSS